MKNRFFSNVFQLFRNAAVAYFNGNAFTDGAALSYYTVFAIAPLFVIALGIAGFCFGEEAARHELYGQLNQLLGDKGSSAVQTMIAAADKTKTGFWATCIAVVTLIVASTGVFVQIQNSLNRLWNVRPRPGRGLRSFIRHRLLSLAMVFGIGFLLLTSLLVSAGLAAIGSFLGRYMAEKEVILNILNAVISIGFITVLFTMMFKFLPDMKIAWRDVWLGGLLTAILFEIGKFLIGFYIARSSLASIYGAIGSLIIVLLWVYYSSQILFFGAHFTRVYVTTFGTAPHPVRDAQIVEPTTKPVDHVPAKAAT